MYTNYHYSEAKYTSVPLPVMPHKDKVSLIVKGDNPTSFELWIMWK